MSNFYFNIETLGFNAKRDKVIAIEYQQLDLTTGKASGKLEILKEWDNNERTILQQFVEISQSNDDYPFSFVPVGHNLNFQHNFLKERTAIHSFTPLDILSKPFIDLKSIAVLMNHGEFKGSGLHGTIGPSKVDKSKIPELYAREQYNEIVNQIESNAKETTVFIEWLYSRLPLLKDEFKTLKL